MSNKAVVLLSGGIDSTTCLAIAVNEYGKGNVYALNIHYGQKHIKEMESAKSIANYYGVEYEEIDIENVFKHSDCSLLKNSSNEIKHKSYSEQLDEIRGEGAVETYVPFRNGIMLSIASAYAVSKGCSSVIYGAHADDAAGSAYPDCTIEFASAMNEAISHGTGNNVILVAPLIKSNKADVVKKGIMLDAPYRLTWSCYEGKEKPCGECGTCIDRKNAFEKNGIKDPLEDLI